jgi:hypothetical protein
VQGQRGLQAGQARRDQFGAAAEAREEVRFHETRWWGRNRT